MFSSGTFSSLSQISAGLSKMWTRKHTKRYGKSLFCHHKCLALFQKHVNKQVKKGSFMVVFPFFMIVGWVPAAWFSHALAHLLYRVGGRVQYDEWWLWYWTVVMVMCHFYLETYIVFSCVNWSVIVLSIFQIEEHLEKECPNTEVKCPFHIVGCTYEVWQLFVVEKYWQLILQGLWNTWVS